MIIHFVWQFIRRQKKRFGTVLAQDIFNCLDLLVWPFLLRWIIDIFTRFETDRMQAWDALQLPVIGAIGFLILIEINSRSMGFSLAKALPQLQADIRMNMFDHVQRHSPHYFNERFAGSLANKITDMTTAVDSLMQQLFWPLIPAVVLSILGAVFLSFVSPLFSIVLLVWICIHLGISLYFSKSCDQYE